MTETQATQQFTNETGLDYFGARYFSGAQGRFTSPDWSAVPQPVPYADLADPQTLNLYSYVWNNPLLRIDLDGHRDLWSRFSDYWTGIGKGVVNDYLKEDGLVGKGLQKVGVQQQVAKNPDQAVGMEDSTTVVALAVMLVPGPKGAKPRLERLTIQTTLAGRRAAKEAKVAISPTMVHPMPVGEER